MRHLAVPSALRHPDLVLSEDDVKVILEALFDIRTELRRIRVLLEEDDGEQGDEEEDP
jgi:hypothetical protein